MIVVLYCDAHTAGEVAESLGLSLLTVRSYIKKARQRYSNAGRDAVNVIQLRERLVEDGYLTV